MKHLRLKRAIGLPLLTLYGLGNILGAGIYVLIGEVAKVSGYHAFASFAAALVVAALTAFTYMELSSRYPKTAGASVYLYQAFKLKLLSVLTGLLLVAAGIVSAATLSKGFVGYFASFVQAPSWLIILGVVIILAGFAVYGIAQSAKLAAVFTVIEIVGLLLVLGAGFMNLENLPQLASGVASQKLGLTPIILGAFLAFYAFIGFEDMIEVAEEVKRPSVSMPKAILLALVISAVLYVLVLASSLLVFTPARLGASSAPLAQVFAYGTGFSPLILAGIGLAAILNGILVQIIMGARILYGLSRQGWIHNSFADLHQASRTPILGTLTVATIVCILAIYLPLVKLAQITSLLVLGVFTLVNLALIVIKLKKPGPAIHYQVPLTVPVLGALTALGMILAAWRFN